MEKSGNLKISQNVDSQQASENYIFNKLKTVHIQNHTFSNIRELRFFFKD